MIHYNYLIIGGGMTADAAVKGIVSTDPKGSIGIISNENHDPYMRPPLSKALWKEDRPESIWLPNAVENAEIHLSRTVTEIRINEKQVVDNQGDVYGFGKLLLATGGTPRTLPYDVDGIIYFRTLDDYNQLRKDIQKGERCVVIGGGFIGSEIAAALSSNHQKVTMIFPEPGIGAKVFPDDLSAFLNDYYTSKGVDVLAGNMVESIVRNGDVYLLKTSGGKAIQADVVVAGLGIEPNTEIALAAGLNAANGVIVNEFLQTSHPDIYAAGDVANFHSPALDMRVRVEHEDNANVMGALAGKNMAGQRERYHYLPFFYSDLFDLGYEAVGELDSRLEIAADWKEEFREGVIYYMEDKRICGVLLWNTWDQVDKARSLIARKETFGPDILIRA